MKKYRLKINPKNGAIVDFISIVESPAIEVDFLKFKKEKLVDPNPQEKETEFISRCMSTLVGDEGYETSQAAAICYSKWAKRNEMAEASVSFDFDDTLSTAKGQDEAKRLIDAGVDVYIVSARSDKESMYEVADKLGIPHSKIFATGSNKAKVEKVKELGVSKHYDNNPDVVSELPKVGQKFQFEKLSLNEDKMELLGPVLIPNQEIYRRSEKMGEYYIYFTAEDIKDIQLEFMKNGFQHNVNLDHSEKMANTYIFGFFQSSDVIPNPKGFEDLPIGTLYAQMRVTDKQIWEDIKLGKRKGFSIEGIFEYLVEEFESAYLEKLENKTTNLIDDQEKNKMEKMIKDLFRKVFTELSQELAEDKVDDKEKAVEYAEWTMASSSDFKIENREVGAKVEVVDADGNLVAAPDGSYEFEDGFKFTVKDGVIASIEGQEAPDAEAEDVEAGKKKDWEKMAEDWQAQSDAMKAEIDALKKEIEDIKSAIGGMPTEENMSKQFESIKNEFKSVFEKFSQIPAEPSKVNKNQVAKEEDYKKFQDFLNTLRK